LPIYRADNDKHSTVEMQVDTDMQLARLYWEHPNLIWSNRGES
jgi:hypothetical protein